jgi:ferredoxin
VLLTLGVKNLFGCVPGSRKALWHLKAGDDRKRFAQMLVDLYSIIPSSLTVLDGVLGMEGNGPGSGHPIELGLILASQDPLAVDQIVCDLLGISRKALPTNRVAFESGLGRGSVEVVGEPLERVRIPDFTFPTLTEPDWNLPAFVKRALKNALTSKPVVEQEICKACHRCEEICPPKALTTKDERRVFDYKKCIRCFCCLEVCPEGAVSIKPGWALKLVSRK